MEEPTCDLKVCRICFITDGELHQMITYGILFEAYKTVTGLLLNNEGDLPPYLCSECVHTLMTCNRFRIKTLQAHSILVDIVKKYGCVTVELIQAAKINQNLQCTSQADCDNQNDIEIIHDEVNSVSAPTDIEHVSELKEDTMINEVKTENHEVIEQDPLHDEDTPTEDINISKLPKIVKAESYSGVNETNIDLDDVDSDQREAVLGENNPTDNGLLLPETDKDVQLSQAQVLDVTQTPMVPALIKSESYQKINGNSTFSCDICPYETKYNVQLLSHLKAHAAPNSYSCNICSYITIHKHNLGSHLYKHSNKRLPYECDICKKQLKSQSNLDVHLRSHFVNRSLNNVFVCKVCNKNFKRKSYLTEHMGTHTGVKLYSCHVCNESFNYKSALSRHLKTHSGEKPYSCDICHKSFRRKYNISVHMRTHSDKKGTSNIKQYTCNVCNKSFAIQNTLNEHMRMHIQHANKTSYSCGLCEKSCNYKCYLKSHIALHSGKTTVSCYVCNKGFNSKGHLTRHLRTHTGERPYSCNICSKTFTQSSILKQHLKIHNDDKPYSCDICKKKFRQKKYLIVHLKHHSVEKQYQCNICNKLIKYKANLTKHLSKHHDKDKD